MLFKYSDGLIRWFEPSLVPFGKLGGTNGRTNCLFTKLGPWCWRLFGVTGWTLTSRGWWWCCWWQSWTSTDATGAARDALEPYGELFSGAHWLCRLYPPPLPSPQPLAWISLAFLFAARGRFLPQLPRHGPAHVAIEDGLSGRGCGIERRSSKNYEKEERKT